MVRLVVRRFSEFYGKTKAASKYVQLKLERGDKQGL